MKIYQGKHNQQSLYIQMGDQPASSDELLALFPDPLRAKFTARILNGDDPPFSERNGIPPESYVVQEDPS